MAKNANSEPATEIEKYTDNAGVAIHARQSDFDFTAIESFQDAFDYASDVFGDLRGADELGDGFAVADKKNLVGTPMILIFWQFNVSELSAEPYVIARAMTRDGRKLVIVDGSTGIRDQLLEYTKKNEGRNGGLLCENGLRESKYQTEVDGKFIQATTYYLDTAKV